MTRSVRRSARCAVLSFLYVHIGLVAAASVPGELDRHVELLDRAAAVRISMEFDGTPLEQAFAAVSEAAQLPAFLDTRELLAYGFDPAEPVHLIFRDTPALTAFEMLGDALGGDFGGVRVEAYGGLLRLTTDSVANRVPMVQRYEIRDILEDAERLERLDAAQRELRQSDDAVEELILSADMALRLLIEILQDMVHPDGWRDLGGTRAITLTQAGSIIVIGPASTHRLVRQALSEIRRPQTASMIFEAMLVRVERSVVGDAIARYPAGSRTLARALTRGHDVRFRSFGTVSVGGTWRVEYGRGEERAGIAFAPMSDGVRGVLRCMIGAQIAGPGGVRSVDTDVDLAPDQQAIIAEIPGDPAEAHVLLLVILTEQSR